MDKIVPSSGPFAGGTTVNVVLSDAEDFDTNNTAVTMETNVLMPCINARYERLEVCYNAQLSTFLIFRNTRRWHYLAFLYYF